MTRERHSAPRKRGPKTAHRDNATPREDRNPGEGVQPAPDSRRSGPHRGRPTFNRAHRAHTKESVHPPEAATPGAGDSTNDREEVQMLLKLYRPDLVEVLREQSAPAYRYEQVFEHLLRRPLQPFGHSTVLPAALRAALDVRGYSTLTTSADTAGKDQTTKLLMTAADGSAIEMVIMRYRQRVTACISSQVGCPVGCAFCATGRGGFSRNLSAAEIADQVRTAAALGSDEGWRLSNLVYMGMGEPLLNLQAVLDSIRIVTHPRGLGLGHRSISVSTVGIPSGIRRLARSEPQVNLALSLHAAEDRTRARLVPATYRHPLVDILSAAWEHFDITHRKLLIEYVLLEGVNDSANDAKRLAALLKGHVVTVNLLSWNAVPYLSARPEEGAATPSSRPTRPANGPTGPQRVIFKASSQATVKAFRDALISAGIETVIRRGKGDDIDAACGQLAGRRPAKGPLTR